MGSSKCACEGLLRRPLLAAACLLWAVVPVRASDGLSVLDQASALKAAGKYDGAISTLRAFIARGAGKDQLALATAWTNLADAYHDLGLCGESKTAYRRAFRLYEQFGDAEFIVRGAMNFAAVLLDCGAHEEAEKLVRRVLGPRMDGFTPSLRGRTLLLLANAQLHRRRCGDAEPLFREALSLLEEETSNYRAAALNGLAVTLARADRKRDAIGELRRALELLDRSGQPAGAITVKTLRNLAAFHHEVKDYDEAEVTYLAALSAATAAFGEADNPTAGLILTDYGNHLRARGRKAEAKKARQRAQAILANTRSHGTVDIEDLRAESGGKR